MAVIRGMQGCHHGGDRRLLEAGLAHPRRRRLRAGAGQRRACEERAGPQERRERRRLAGRPSCPWAHPRELRAGCPDAGVARPVADPQAAGAGEEQPCPAAPEDVGGCQHQARLGHLRRDRPERSRHETYVGGKAKNRAYAKKPPKKQAVVALVERKGKVKSVHVANVTSETLRPILVNPASRKSRLMTDESNVYPKIGEEFAEHDTVNHSANEYVRSDAHTNTAEGYFSIFKRGIYGVYHHVSEAPLHRYLVEFDFRHNTRTALGVNDTQRAAKAMQGMVGKRLMYRRPDQAAHA